MGGWIKEKLTEKRRLQHKMRHKGKQRSGV
jgi:hypothetical protein